ncbi:MAG: hypothetical protein LBV72_12860 [Tannerella sp.]|jgi:hypothetical protein|nr:hypothetical protein [Tannerella sp.]
MAQTVIKTSGSVSILPDFTGHPQWIEGIVIDVEDNTLNGIVSLYRNKRREYFHR